MGFFGRRTMLPVAAGILVIALAAPAWAISWSTTLQSSASNGTKGNFNSYHPQLSADGRFATFYSVATNLVPSDTNGVSDIFVKDLTTGAMTRASVNSAEGQSTRASREPQISGDGRFVVFQTFSPLVPGDTNAASDIFVRDTILGTTSRVSISSAGEQGNGDSLLPMVSQDGRYVAFYSSATNLVPGDTNAKDDIFVHDTSTGTTTRVSISSSGAEGNGASSAPSLSADGSLVSFSSGSTNLVANDTNARNDIFVHDTATGQTERASVASDGRQAVAGSTVDQISADGRYVTFATRSRNLVPDDTNQKSDVFLHDRETGETIRVSVSTDGDQSNANSAGVAVGIGGRYVFWHTPAGTLVDGDTNHAFDIFRHDTQTGETIIVSRSSSGEQGDLSSHFVGIAPDGATVAYHSDATNLVAGDPSVQDIFVTEIGP